MIPAIGSKWSRVSRETERLFDACEVLEVFALRADHRHPQHPNVRVRRATKGRLIARCRINDNETYLAVRDLRNQWAPSS